MPPSRSGQCFAQNKNGSPARTRTWDMVINSHPLYQLSYRGMNWYDEIGCTATYTSWRPVRALPNVAPSA